MIRVNSQSGKGGISYLLETHYGVELPRRLQIEFGQLMQTMLDDAGKELTAADIWQIFEREYGLRAQAAPTHRITELADAPAYARVEISATMELCGEHFAVHGHGSGPIEAFVNGVKHSTGHDVRVLDYHEHALGSGTDARAIAYLELRVDGQHTLFGVGIDASFVSASLKAIVGALARAKIGRGICLPAPIATATAPSATLCV